jgi:hypothetical protein
LFLRIFHFNLTFEEIDATCIKSITYHTSAEKLTGLNEKRIAAKQANVKITEIQVSSLEVFQVIDFLKKVCQVKVFLI